MNRTPVSWNWVQKFFNLSKQASYEDKRTQINREHNPFYLLEWLVIADTALLESLHFSRTPGLAKNSYLSWSDVFLNELLADLMFSAAGESLIGRSGPLNRLLLHTAVFELSDYYGVDAWRKACEELCSRLRKSADQFDRFAADFQRKQQKLQDELAAKLVELEEAIFEETRLAEQQRTAHDAMQQKLDGTVRKLLTKNYKLFPLVAYFYHKGWERPLIAERIEQFTVAVNWIELPYRSLIFSNDYEFACRQWIDNPEERLLFITWYTAYAAKSDFNRGQSDLQRRQSWWAGLLDYLALRLNEAGLDKTLRPLPRELQEVVEQTYHINGFVEVMLWQRTMPAYFSLFVRSVLCDDKRCKWLRESVILRHWSLFDACFMEGAYDFNSLSWVLCLDPYSLEQRLLRENTAQFPFVAERCCTVFADAIRFGLETDRIAHILHYMASRSPEMLYTYILNANSEQELEPLLRVEFTESQSGVDPFAAVLNQRNARAKAARLHLHAQLESMLSKDNANVQFMRRLAKLILIDRVEWLLNWWKRQSAPYENPQTELLSEWFQVRWIGLHPKGADLHEQVLHLLDRQSEQVQFEHDTAPVRPDAVRYEILRPGFADIHTGETLARVIVRAKLQDIGSISDLLDDLGSL